MQFTITRSILKDALAGLGKVVFSKSALPILRCIRFDRTSTGIRLTATDLDQFLFYHCEARDIAPGRPLLIDHEALKPLATGKADDPLTFRADGDERVLLTETFAGQTVERRLESRDPADWPPDPPNTPIQPVEGPFMSTVRTALEFAARDAARAQLHAVYLDVSEPEHHVIATDGRRLTALNGLRLPLTKSVILPATKLLAWTRLEDAPQIGLSICGDSQWFRLDTLPWSYYVRTRDGTYPSWRQVVPATPGDSRLTLSDADVEVLERVLGTFPGHDQPDRLVRLMGKAGRLTLSGRGRDETKPTELALPTSRYAGPALDIGVNREFLLDALRAGFREFTCPDAEGPILATAASGIHVLMPIRLTSGRPAVAQPATEPESAPQTDTPIPTSKPKKETPMPENNDEAKNPSAIDRILLAYEAAKAKVKEANEALALIASAVKDAVREDRQRRNEIASVRAGLAKLQAIKV